jgi:hypothetical protein
MGFRLVTGVTEHLEIVTTTNYSGLANSRIRLLTTAHTKPSQFVFPSRCLVTDPNNTDSLASLLNGSCARKLATPTGKP